jgi:hypothetical protein
LRQHTLDAAGRNIGKLRSAIERVKATDAARLTAEYNRLVSGLMAQGALGGPAPDNAPADNSGGRRLIPGEEWFSNPTVPDDILRESVHLVLSSHLLTADPPMPFSCPSPGASKSCRRAKDSPSHLRAQVFFILSWSLPYRDTGWLQVPEGTAYSNRRNAFAERGH